MNTFETRHADIHQSKRKSPLKGIIVEAHNDDLSMFRLTRKLARYADLTIVTLTDGSARDLPGYTPQELASRRWKEGQISAWLAGAVTVDRIEIPDGHLSEHSAFARAFLANIAEETNAGFIVAPNVFDLHPDHVCAHMTALQAAENHIPVYAMDTITGLDFNNQPLIPDMYVPLSRRLARREKQIYRANESQVTNISLKQRRAVFDVLGMTQRRGKEIGVEHAGVIFAPKNTQKDPLREIFKDVIF